MKHSATAIQRALEAFGQAVRTERKRRELSQEQLAELADVHMTYVGKVERAEKNVSFENIFRLSHALDLKPSILLAKAGL